MSNIRVIIQSPKPEKGPSLQSRCDVVHKEASVPELGCSRPELQRSPARAVGALSHIVAETKRLLTLKPFHVGTFRAHSLALLIAVLAIAVLPVRGMHGSGGPPHIPSLNGILAGSLVPPEVDLEVQICKAVDIINKHGVYNKTAQDELDEHFDALEAHLAQNHDHYRCDVSIGLRGDIVEKAETRIANLKKKVASCKDFNTQMQRQRDQPPPGRTSNPSSRPSNRGYNTFNGARLVSALPRENGDLLQGSGGYKFELLGRTDTSESTNPISSTETSTLIQSQSASPKSAETGKWARRLSKLKFWR